MTSVLSTYDVHLDKHIDKYLPVQRLRTVLMSSRSSRPEVFCKKGTLRNFTKFTGKHLCQRLFSNKVAGLAKFCEMSKNTFFTEHIRTTASYTLLFSQKRSTIDVRHNPKYVSNIFLMIFTAVLLECFKQTNQIFRTAIFQDVFDDLILSYDLISLFPSI